MALQFEVESLDGLDEGLHSLYAEKDGKYRLEVEGIDPADELKEALRKEREETKAERAKRLAIEQSKAEFEEKTAKERGEYKTLWEKEQDAKRQLQEKLNSFKQATVEKEKSLKIVEATAALTKDENKAEALRGILNQFISVDEDGNVSYTKDGEEVNKSDLTDYLKEKYPFLVDGSKASGGVANGNSGTGGSASVMTREEFRALKPMERSKFFKDGGKLVD